MEIKTSEFVKSSSRVEEGPKDWLKQYAFIGRSNVGKSSLINMLVGRKDFAKTSSRPGKTMLINHFKLNNNFYFVDLPGYGYAKLSKSAKEQFAGMIADYLLKSEQLQCLFVLLDLRLEMQKNDLDFLIWVAEKEIPVALVFTKSDKLTKSGIVNAYKKYEQQLLGIYEFLPDIFITSATTQAGKKELLKYIDQFNV
jgi:GTP-binding protein